VTISSYLAQFLALPSTQDSQHSTQGQDPDLQTRELRDFDERRGWTIIIMLREASMGCPKTFAGRSLPARGSSIFGSGDVVRRKFSMWRNI
jgi:hypothetical protein